MCVLPHNERSSYAFILPIQCTGELVVVKAEGGLEWGHSSPVLRHQRAGLKDTKEGGLHLLLGMLKACLWGRVNLLAVRSSSWHDAHDLRFWRAVFPLTSWVRIRGCIYWLAAVQVEPLAPAPPPKHSPGSIAHLPGNNRIVEAQQGQGQRTNLWCTDPKYMTRVWSPYPVCSACLCEVGENEINKGNLMLMAQNHIPPHSHWIPCCELCRSRSPSFFQSWWRCEVHSLPGAAPDMWSEGMWCLGPSDSGWELYWRESRL